MHEYGYIDGYLNTCILLHICHENAKYSKQNKKYQNNVNLQKVWNASRDNRVEECMHKL